ncbi:TPA_asm: hypothetical protein [Monosiga MELD virus 2]|nr:TPA_asm: hypothetical protein [Monosiga MELD virus 2]
MDFSGYANALNETSSELAKKTTRNQIKAFQDNLKEQAKEKLKQEIIEPIEGVNDAIFAKNAELGLKALKGKINDAVNDRVELGKQRLQSRMQNAADEVNDPGANGAESIEMQDLSHLNHEDIEPGESGPSADVMDENDLLPEGAGSVEPTPESSVATSSADTGADTADAVADGLDTAAEASLAEDAFDPAGLLITGALALGGALASAFGHHHHHHPADNTPVANPSYQMGISS